MDAAHHTMQELFAQLGLADGPDDITAFICKNRPLPMTTRLFDAPFWNASQAALIQEKLQDDGDWSLLIDTLNTQLRAHPSGVVDLQADAGASAVAGQGQH